MRVFRSYLADVADVGFTLDLNSRLEIMGKGAYIYRGIEMLVVAVLTFGVIFRVDNNPYLINIRQNRKRKASRTDDLDTI